MPDLLALLTIWGLPIVAVAVVLDAGGLPLPAFPVIIAASAVAMARGEPPLDVLAVATAAALLGDLLWYLAGRRAGRRILDTLCRLSLSPDYCVRQTENLFTRYGAPSLVFAKFVPGFSALATAMAGTYRVGLGWFCLFDGIGSLLWAGTAVLLGVGFAGTFDRLLATLAGLGRAGVAVLLLALGAWIAVRWWQRVRFNRQLRMARISVPELGERLAAGDSPVIIDVRGAASRELDGMIPGALLATLADADRLARELPRDRDVVIYCACPNEATAALLARRLLGRGVVRVRPLAGGMTAWRAAGLPVAGAGGSLSQSPLP